MSKVKFILVGESHYDPAAIIAVSEFIKRVAPHPTHSFIFAYEQPFTSFDELCESEEKYLHDSEQLFSGLDLAKATPSEILAKASAICKKYKFRDEKAPVLCGDALKYRNTTAFLRMLVPSLKAANISAHPIDTPELQLGNALDSMLECVYTHEEERIEFMTKRIVEILKESEPQKDLIFIVLGGAGHTQGLINELSNLYPESRIQACKISSEISDNPFFKGQGLFDMLNRLFHEPVTDSPIIETFHKAEQSKIIEWFCEALQEEKKASEPPQGVEQSTSSQTRRLDPENFRKRAVPSRPAALARE